MIPQYSAADYRNALLSLLPTGPIWNRSLSGGYSRLFAILGSVYERNNARAASLIEDLFPGTTEQFLPEWEATLGLPDSCVTGRQTQAERRVGIITALTDEGGSSIAYYRRLAARSGISISVRQFAPARAGVLKAGQPCCGQDWAYVWEVTLPKTLTLPFRASWNAAGEPLRSWGGGYLECMLSKRSPAHTILIFRYEDAEGGVQD